MTKTAPVQKNEMPPAAFVMDVAMGALMTQALFVAAKLGIADLLINGKKSIAELAHKTATNEPALYRVLRSLASIGIFSEVGEKEFELTPNAEVLRSDSPDSMRNVGIFCGEMWHWQVWGNLVNSVKTGRPSWGFTHGEDVFGFFQKNPQASEIFNNAMTDMSSSIAPVIARAYDFSGIETLADIAGGHGFLLAKILQVNPSMNGILFDFEHVLAGADGILEREGVAKRVEKISGDFFKEVPPADAYIMKHIIHDWDDERSIMILRTIHRAMGKEGKVLLAEFVIPEGNEPHPGKLLDLEMLVSPGGIERTAKEYEKLFADSGFKLTKIYPTESPYSVIEAVKA
jgi:hypothetical protein